MFCFRISVSQGWKQFQATPQNRILVSLRGSFQNFRRASPSFFYGSPPGRVVGQWRVYTTEITAYKGSTDSILVRLIVFWICCPLNVMQTPRTEVHRQRLLVPSPNFCFFLWCKRAVDTVHEMVTVISLLLLSHSSVKFI